MQKSGTDFINNTLILFIGRICTKLIQFCLLPLYTSILTTSEYGTVDLISAYVTILVVLVNLQLEQAIFRYLAEERQNDENKDIVITNVMFISFLQIILFTIVYLLIQSFITIDGKIFLLLNVFASVFMTTMMQITRGLGDYKTYAKGSFLSAISIILFNLLFLLGFNMKIIGLLLSTFIAYIICSLYLLMKKKIYKYIQKKHLNRSKQKELLGYSIPLVPNELSWQAIKSSDKIIVSYALGKAYNGILSVSMRFSAVYNEIYSIFNTSLVDAVISNIRKQEGQVFITRLINRIFILFLSIAFLLITVMPFIFGIFVNKSYAEAFYYIPLYIISSFINVMVGLISGIFVADKRTKLIAVTSFIAGFINIIVDLLLIDLIGLYAAVFSTILGYLIMFIIRYFIILKNYSIHIEIKNFLLAIIGIIVVLFTYYSNNLIIQLLALLMVILISFWLNFDTLKRVLKFIAAFFQTKISVNR